MTSLLTLVRICFLSTSVLVNADGCKEMTFKDTLEGKAMKNHVFMTERATNEGHCESKCFLDDRCIAYSFGRDKDNQKDMCELSESDHVMHPEDLVDRPDTVYRRAKNNCQCQKYHVCRVNFVDNTHRCDCKPSFTGNQCEIEYKHIGCFKDASNRALSDYLGTVDKNIAIGKCAQLAKERAFTTFAVQYGGQCYSGAKASETYDMYGPASNCADGVGGTWSNDVYVIV